MKKLLVLVEVTGSTTEDTNHINTDFTDHYISLFDSEQLATEAVKIAIEHEIDQECDTIEDDVFVEMPYQSHIAEKYERAIEYSFREFKNGQPDEISVIIGLSHEK
ncbi:hypothetical protein [Vibrio sonorensis]|uniref:hypothetical protein n=1 Tax=Vibrio sonorensis TaxID=1004316 RepID=UPI0008D8FBA4|nr:hypothetical protein [Vibrio sonorensis]